MILLTDEEIMGVVLDEGLGVVADDNTRAIAKAQLKKVKGKLAVVEIPKGKEAGYNVDGKQYVALAMSVEDWQALLEEVKE